jgi:hypothetical protein
MLLHVGILPSCHWLNEYPGSKAGIAEGRILKGATPSQEMILVMESRHDNSFIRTQALGHAVLGQLKYLRFTRPICSFDGIPAPGQQRSASLHIFLLTLPLALFLAHRLASKILDVGIIIFHETVSYRALSGGPFHYKTLLPP